MTKSGKHCDKRRNCTFWAISFFVTMVSKSRLLQRRQKVSIWGKGLSSQGDSEESIWYSVHVGQKAWSETPHSIHVCNRPGHTKYFKISNHFRYRLGGVVAERPFRLREFTGSIPGLVITETLNMIVIASLLGDRGRVVSITTDLLVSG